MNKSMGGLSVAESEVVRPHQDNGLEATEVAVEDDVRLEVPEAFIVHDEASANWVVNKVIEARARAVRAAEWCERIQRRSKAEENHLLFRFEGQLRQWLAGEIDRHRGRRKSVCLPSATVGYRVQKALLVIDDEQAVLTWARATCPSAVAVCERVSKSVFNEYVLKTGEMPPTGAHVEPERERFYIR